MLALGDHTVYAQVVDLDHYRIRGGMACDTDYIIRVEPKEGSNASFESFTLSKTYSAFRTLAHQLKKISDSVMGSGSKSVDDSTKKLAQYCETVSHLVNYNYVQVLAKKRSQIVQEVLDATLNHFPKSLEGKNFNIQVAQAIETFFLCDHCTEVEVEQSSKHGVGEGRHYSKSFDDDDSTQGSTKGSRQKGSANPIEDAVKTVGKFLKHLEEPGKLNKSATSGVEKSASTP
ncbi:MAG: hypothetical protein SGARI_006789, partial [Bacillariaceae sp.]